MIELIAELEAPSHNSEYNKLVEKYLMYYLKNFWKAFTSFSIFAMVLCEIAYLWNPNYDNPHYKFSVVLIPCLIVCFCTIDVIISKYKGLLKYVFIFYILGVGISISHENALAETYKYYEIWVWVNAWIFMISIVQALEHKKVIAAFLFVQIYYFWLMHYVYGVLNPQFYMGFVIYVILFPMIPVGVSKLVRDLLKLLQENKELAETIQIILQRFPEAVLITSLNNFGGESILHFANNLAKNNFIWNWDKENHKPHLNHSVIVENERNEEQSGSDLIDDPLIQSISNYLKYHEKQWASLSKSASSKIKILSNIDGSESNKFYQLKSVKVKWNECEESYMHMFVDTTTIKEWEKEKATNKWLHAMFSSVSHEFRTPINAISNSIDLMILNFTKIK